MSNQPIIEIKNIGKKYDIEHQRGRYIALRDVLTNIAFNPFAFLKTKTKNALGLSHKEEFWALRGVNIDIHAGEVVGIIGHNGAGKSTLLKILTGITPPTEGEIIMRGSVSSLLEVGTGFHPELTGRENIFLNGAILGMTKEEIVKNFDDIVEFSGVEKFLDTPVKYYSSGMYVRLAFSVAAHMEPDILLVDEVLAVGDAEFQRKCLGKMKEVTSKKGRTILFVSHNLSAVQELCERSVLLDHGNVVMVGRTADVVEKYLENSLSNKQTVWEGAAGDENAKLLKSEVKTLDKDKLFHTGAKLEVSFTYEVLQPIDNLVLGFTLFSEFGYELAYTLYDDKLGSSPERIEPGVYTQTFTIPANTLSEGLYRIEVDLGIHNVKRIVQTEGALAFSLLNVDGYGKRFPLPSIKGRTSLFRPGWSNYEQ